MSNKVRFVDNLKVGAYKVLSETGGIQVLDNVNNYVLTATGDPLTIRGESELVFDGLNLGIGVPTPLARVEIGDAEGNDLLLIKNTTTNQGIRVNRDGILQLLEFPTLPTAVEGGVAYNNNSFWVGVNS